MSPVPTDGNPAAPLVTARDCPLVTAHVTDMDHRCMAGMGTLLTIAPPSPGTEFHLPFHLQSEKWRRDWAGIGPALLPADRAACSGRAIKAYRSLRGWSQAQLAEASGIPAGTIGALEVDYYRPSADALRKLYATMGVQP